MKEFLIVCLAVVLLCDFVLFVLFFYEMKKKKQGSGNIVIHKACTRCAHLMESFDPVSRETFYICRARRISVNPNAYAPELYGLEGEV